MGVQWLGLRAPTAEGLGSVPGKGTKIPLLCGVTKTIKIKVLTLRKLGDEHKGILYYRCKPKAIY